MNYGWALGGQLDQKYIKKLYNFDMNICLKFWSKNGGGDGCEGTRQKWAGEGGPYNYQITRQNIYIYSLNIDGEGDDDDELHIKSYFFFS